MTLLIALPWTGVAPAHLAESQTVSAKEDTVFPQGPGLGYGVDSTGDGGLVGSSNFCDDGTGKCTLRAAIQAANLHLGNDSIGFVIPASDPGCFGGSCTINLTSALPDVIESVSITGPGPNQVTVRRGTGGEYRIFNVTTSGTVNISGLTISNGIPSSGTFYGGGVQNLNAGIVNITNSTISGNLALGGGGINNNGAGSVNVTNSTISGNSGGDIGGGIANVGTGTVRVTNSIIDDNTNSSFRQGGGVYNNGIVTITGSTISRNRGGDGGGIFNSGGIVDITNSTVSNNTAFQDGGGIANYISGTVNVSNSTISGNTANTAPGVGGIRNNSGIVRGKSSIIALNTGSTFDFGGSFTSNGFNLIGKIDGSFGAPAPTDQTGTVASPLDPKLDPAGLQGNGGPTQTIALLCGSPAIDKGTSASLMGALTTDQRGAGFPRTFDDPVTVNVSGGNGTDIGAFERQQSCAPPTATPTATLTVTLTPTRTATPLATLTPTASRTVTMTLLPTETATPVNTNTATASATGTPTSTRTPTVTPPATFIPTSTPIGGVTLTRTPTVVSTSTAAPTITPPAFGVHDFALQLAEPGSQGGSLGGRATGDRLFSWQPRAQARSLVLRWSQTQGITFLPSFANPLAAGVGSYRDSTVLTDPISCYLLLSIVGEVSTGSERGLSDLLCVVPNTGSGNRPRDFTGQLNQSGTASLSWSGPGGQTGYQLVARQLNGTFPVISQLPAGQTSTSMPTGGEVTCFQLYAASGTQIMGVTDGLCAIPGVSSAGVGGAGGQPSPDLGRAAALFQPEMTVQAGPNGAIPAATPMGPSSVRITPTAVRPI